MTLVLAIGLDRAVITVGQRRSGRGQRRWLVPARVGGIPAGCKAKREVRWRARRNGHFHIERLSSADRATCRARELLRHGKFRAVSGERTPFLYHRIANERHRDLFVNRDTDELRGCERSPDEQAGRCAQESASQWYDARRNCRIVRQLRARGDTADMTSLRNARACGSCNTITDAA